MQETFVLDDNKRQDIYVEMFRGVPDAIFVLSGGVKKVTEFSEEAVYLSTDYSDSDPYGMLAGKAQVDAAAEVGRYFPTTKIVTTTHSPSPDIPGNFMIVHAYVLADELKHLGVPEEQIIFEVKSTNTLTELQEMVKLIAHHQWHRVGIITFELHAPRTAIMLKHLEKLSGLPDLERRAGLLYIERIQPEIVIVRAEDILWHTSSHYRHLIEHARTRPSYQKRFASERDGIEAVRSLTYQPTGETWKIQSERAKINETNT